MEIDIITKNNKLLKKFAIEFKMLIAFAAFILMITTLNLTFWVFSDGTLATSDRVAIGLSYASALFGMANITTYSMMNLNSKHKNKFKIFIVFNVLAVSTLAIINIYNNLWFLFFENILFAFSGFYQYYKWFIKPSETTGDHGWYYISPSVSTNKKLLMVGGITLGAGIAMLSSLEITHLTFGSMATFDYVNGIIDGLVFTLSFTAAMVVGRRWIESQWIYIISDTILILLWIYIGIADPRGMGQVNLLTSINLVALFSFYAASNIINIINFSPKKEENKVLVK